jgi:hypothetical protein
MYGHLLYKNTPTPETGEGYGFSCHGFPAGKYRSQEHIPHAGMFPAETFAPRHPFPYTPGPSPPGIRSFLMDQNFLSACPVSASSLSSNRRPAFLPTTLSPAAIPLFITRSGDCSAWKTSGTQTRSAIGVMQKSRVKNTRQVHRPPAGKKPANGTVQITPTASRWSGGTGAGSGSRIKEGQKRI